jgi:hypothetical protein
MDSEPVLGALQSATATLGDGWEHELDIARCSPNGAIAFVAKGWRAWNWPGH